VERIWKEVAVSYSRNYPSICLEGLREATDNLRMAGVLAEIRTEHLPNARPACSVYVIRVGWLTCPRVRYIEFRFWLMAVFNRIKLLRF
jgi:hypothetical protein